MKYVNYNILIYLSTELPVVSTFPLAKCMMLPFLPPLTKQSAISWADANMTKVNIN